MASLSALLCGTFLLSGCVTQSNFPAKVAEAECDKYFECSKTLSEVAFGDIDNCIEKKEAVYDELVARCDDWDGRVASKCIDTVQDASCSSLKIDSKPCEELLDICK